MNNGINYCAKRVDICPKIRYTEYRIFKFRIRYGMYYIMDTKNGG